jgi:uncharacterized protein YegP (UPF0339 family)
MMFHIFQGHDGSWRWQLRSSNGRMPAASDTHTRRSVASRAAEDCYRVLHAAEQYPFLHKGRARKVNGSAKLGDMLLATKQRGASTSLRLTQKKSINVYKPLQRLQPRPMLCWGWAERRTACRGDSVRLNTWSFTRAYPIFKAGFGKARVALLLLPRTSLNQGIDLMHRGRRSNIAQHCYLAAFTRSAKAAAPPKRCGPSPSNCCYLT